MHCNLYVETGAEITLSPVRNAVSLTAPPQVRKIAD